MNWIKGISLTVRIPIMAIVLILLPAAVLSYIDFVSVNERARNLETGYRGTLLLVRDRIDRELYQTRCGLTWTADSRCIIFTKRDNGWGLWRISAEGGEPENLGSASGKANGMSIHPDGKHLALSAAMPEIPEHELWVLENFLP
jgi:hypothetical protein